MGFADFRRGVLLNRRGRYYVVTRLGEHSHGHHAFRYKRSALAYAWLRQRFSHHHFGITKVGTGA